MKEKFNPNISYYGYLVRSLLLKIYMNGKMLDFGCGSKPYKYLFDVKEYVGLDYEDEGHSHKEEQIDIFYDSSFSSEVLEHVYNFKEMVIEINRV